MRIDVNNYPEWFWIHGLHDAHILEVTVKEAFDVKNDNKFFDKSCMAFQIDSEGAMYEQDITEIRFYNFKILSENFDLNDLRKGWWISDSLEFNDDRYFLDLDFQTKKCKDRNLKLRFQRAEVLRK